jgi:hypothetical protein
MAETSAPSAAALTAGFPEPEPLLAAGHAIFALSRPLKVCHEGAEIEVDGVGMRAIEAADLPLFDRFHGQPVALAQNVVAALCDLTLDQVRALDLEDFGMLASDALWQVEQATAGMGLPPRFFLEPRAEGAAA